jgi:hypothetical protein
MTRRHRPLTLDQLVERVRREFAALPGLRLSESQVRRLWSVDATVSRHVLRRLVDGEFLREAGHGVYERHDIRGGVAQPRRRVS